MKILIINIDSKKIPNLALKKIEKYHLDKGDEVIWDMPLFAHLSDKIYVSCVFEKNRDKCREWTYRKRKRKAKILIGGSGYNLKTELPEEIEKIKPKINLGFTTRGCIRNCKFCIVPQKEGRIRVVGDLLDLWDGKSKDIVLLDNNILALPVLFKLICKQARENNIRLDFNQGLDCRLLNQDMVDDLNSIRHKELHFAWDNMSDYSSVREAIDLLQKNRINRCTWFILTGFNTTIEEDILRAKYLRDRGQRGYVMRYNNSKDRKLLPLTQWVNHKGWFSAMTWEEFLKTEFCMKRGYNKLAEGIGE